MDGDENDLLSTNVYIPNPELGELNNESNEEFRKYYKNEMEKLKESKIKENYDKTTLISMQLDEASDASNILNTNKFDTTGVSQNLTNQSVIRYKKDVITYVSIDSRNRDKIKYPKASNFKIFLGKTFYNVKNIKLIRVEFPNTDAVINSANNKIYWRNQEDITLDIINNITKEYPVYTSTLRIGSYISTTLQNEITNKMSSIIRQNGEFSNSDYHYFQINLDTDTDIVTFTSLLTKPLKNNPLTTIINTGIISVDTATPHGLSDGDTIYIIGAKNISGIPASTINTSHTITVIGTGGISTQFQFEVNIKAVESGVGGGNTMLYGKLAPFQLLFGENSNTVAPNLGFPLENSSERIVTYIKKIEQIYMLQVKTVLPHGFQKSYTYLNTQCALINFSPSIINGNYTIVKVVDNYTFILQTSSTLPTGQIITPGKVKYPPSADDSTAIEITLISDVSNSMILVTTFSDHNFEIIDNDVKTINFLNVPTTPLLPDSYSIYSILSNTQIIINASILPNGGFTPLNPAIGDGGSMPRHDPLITNTIQLDTDPINFVTGNMTTIKCAVPHGLVAGQYIKFFNIYTVPSILNKNDGVFPIYSVPDGTTFIIDFKTHMVEEDTLINGLAYIGTNIITMSFPNHGFNDIISITRYTGDNYVKINTGIIAHALVTDDNVLILNSNSIPSIDNNDYATNYTTHETYPVTKVDDYNFSIVYSGGITTDGNSGYITNETYVNTITNIYKHAYIKITTPISHGLSTGNVINILESDSDPSIVGNGYPIVVLDNFTYLMEFTNNIVTPGTSGLYGLSSNLFVITSITNGDPETIVIKTSTVHGFSTGNIVRIIQTNSDPVVDTLTATITVVDPTTFTIVFIGGITLDGNTGVVGLTTAFKTISAIEDAEEYIKIECDNHGYNTNDTVEIIYSDCVPTLHTGLISDITGYSVTKVNTNNFIVVYPGGLTSSGSKGKVILKNDLVKINTITNDPKFLIKTKNPGTFETDQIVRISGTNTIPSLDGGYKIIHVEEDPSILNDEFIITYTGTFTDPGSSISVPSVYTGKIGLSHDFYIYGATSVGGISTFAFNNVKHTVKEIIDENTFTFEVSEYASAGIRGGGTNVYISSLLHGFSGIQTNTKNSLLNRSINLEGENYVFLTCPQLATMMNTGRVKDIFARITLDQSPGNMVFNFLSNPKIFDVTPLNQLNELDFSVVYYNNNYYEFNDLDYSFVLEITEEIDTTDGFDISSRRGISNIQHNVNVQSNVQSNIQNNLQTKL